MKKDNATSIYAGGMMFLIWLTIWAAAAFAVRSELILPGPVSTVRALSGIVVTGQFWLDVIWTILRVILGMTASIAAGFACAVPAAKNKAMRDFLRLPVSFFKSIPVMAIIIYVILIVKADWVAVIVCFFMCFPIAYTNMLNGLMNMSRQYDELGSMLGLTDKQKWSLISKPELQPQIRASVNLIAGMSWKVVVAAEVLAIPEHSIGYQMLNSKYYLNTADLFAYILVLIVLSLAVEKLSAYAAEMDYRRVGRRVRDEVIKAFTAAAKVDGSPETGNGTTPVAASLEHVSKSYISDDSTQKKVLEDLSLEFTQGITALLGPSGEGKTTIARLIMGLERPDEGTVSVVPSADPDVLFQEDRLLPWLTMEENMMLAFIREAAKDPERAVKEMAEKLEIADSLQKMPDELSGGMAHRTALGRALLGGSRLLILDEPFRGLNEDLKGRILKNIDHDMRTGRGEQARTVILITHEEKLAEMIADSTVRI